MKKQGHKVQVHCFFTEDGESLQELITRSLRIFIEIRLRGGINF